MLPLWVRYYGGQLGTDNLYVLDDKLRGRVHRQPAVRRPGPPADPRRKVQQHPDRPSSATSGAAAQLYHVGLSGDTDEFIVPDPDRHAGPREH